MTVFILMAANYSSSFIETPKATISIWVIKCAPCLPACLSVCLSVWSLHRVSSQAALQTSSTAPRLPQLRCYRSLYLILPFTQPPVPSPIVWSPWKPGRRLYPVSLRGSRLPSSSSISRCGCAPPAGRSAQRRADVIKYYRH